MHGEAREVQQSGMKPSQSTVGTCRAHPARFIATNSVKGASTAGSPPQCRPCFESVATLLTQSSTAYASAQLNIQETKQSPHRSDVVLLQASLAKHQHRLAANTQQIGLEGRRGRHGMMARLAGRHPQHAKLCAECVICPRREAACMHASSPCEVAQDNA